MDGSVSLIYIFQKQQLDEAVLFKELFGEFNSRYESLNDELGRIKVSPRSQWTDDQNAILEEYFNLCCEEYLYFKKGFIYQETWDSWVKGMRIFFVGVKKKKWLEDMESNSGYGLTLYAKSPEWRESKQKREYKREPKIPLRPTRNWFFI